MAADRVPMKIWDRIIDFIHEEEPQDAIKSLISLCRTSQTLNIAATPFLYRNIYVTIDNEAGKKLPALLAQRPDLALHIHRIYLTKSQLDPDKLTGSQILRFSQKHRPNLYTVFGKYVALLFKAAQRVQHVSIHHQKGTGDDAWYSARVTRKMQQLGHLGNLRTFEISIEETHLVPSVSLEEQMVTEVMKIPMLEEISFSLEPSRGNWYFRPPKAIGAKILNFTSSAGYDNSSINFMGKIVRECKILEHLVISKGRSQHNILAPDNERIHLPSPQGRRTHTIITASQELIVAISVHRHALKSLSIDTEVFDCHPSNFGIVSLEQFTALEILHVETTAGSNFRRLRQETLIQRLMAPNLKHFSITTYANPRKFSQTTGVVLLLAPKSLQTFKMTFLRYMSHVSFDKCPKFNHFTTETFDLASTAGDGWSPLLIFSSNDFQKVISICHDHAPVPPLDADCQVDRRIPLRANVRHFVNGTMMARDFNKLYRMTTALTPPGPVRIEEVL